jgi:hypothetical protein
MLRLSAFVQLAMLMYCLAITLFFALKTKTALVVTPQSAPSNYQKEKYCESPFDSACS